MKKLGGAVAVVWLMAVTGIMVKGAQKAGEDMRTLNVSVEVTNAQYDALERRTARISKELGEEWPVMKEIEFTAAAAIIGMAEKEIRKEQIEIENARIDAITDDNDAPFRVVSAQREVVKPAPGDDPKGEPGGTATTPAITGAETIVADDTARREAEHDLFLRCIQAEAGNQSLECKTATAEVIMNRVTDPRFKNSITEVIMEPGQFSVVSNGSIKTAIPDETTIEAVAAAMGGSRNIPDDYVFFNNAPIGSDVIKIGGHYFGR